jgi:hypothetical protein
MKLKKQQKDSIKRVLDDIVKDYYHDKDNDGFQLKDINWLKVGGLVIKVVLAYFANHVDKAQE